MGSAGGLWKRRTKGKVRGEIEKKEIEKKIEKRGKMKGKTVTVDLTKGKPISLIIGFALPMFLGTLFQQFYSMVDTNIVSK